MLLEHGEPVATWTDETGWSGVAFQKLLHETATGFRMPDAHTLVLQFETGHELFLIEDEQYESIHIFTPQAPQQPWII